MKLPDTLSSLAIQADLTLDTPEGQVTIRDHESHTLEVRFPDTKVFRHLLLGIRPKLSWYQQQQSLQSWVEQTKVTVRVWVGRDIYFRMSPDRPRFVYLVPILIQYIRAKLNL
jgi:hypothetical protein